MKGYKGFNEKFQCTPDGKVFQYEVGKEYEHNGSVDWCSSGFHFVEFPLAVFGFYSPTGKFAEVEADGVSDRTDESTKRVAKRLKITAEVSLSALIGLGVKFILDKVDFTKAPSTNTGDRSAATNTGYRSAATNTGEEGCAISLGIEGKASGAKGCWLTLAEWKEDGNDNWRRIDVKTVKVDGKKIKAETFYSLMNGKFTEVRP